MPPQGKKRLLFRTESNLSWDINQIQRWFQSLALCLRHWRHCEQNREKKPTKTKKPAKNCLNKLRHHHKTHSVVWQELSKNWTEQHKKSWRCSAELGKPTQEKHSSDRGPTNDVRRRLGFVFVTFQDGWFKLPKTNRPLQKLFMFQNFRGTAKGGKEFGSKTKARRDFSLNWGKKPTA